MLLPVAIKILRTFGSSSNDVSPFDDTDKLPRRNVPLPERPEPAAVPPRSRILLVRFRTDEEAMVVPFGRTVAGRALDAGLGLRSRAASRQHAAIMVSASQVIVEDLGSENGTTINGTPIDGPCPLEDGDMVAFADLVFRVEITRATPAGR